MVINASIDLCEQAYKNVHNIPLRIAQGDHILGSVVGTALLLLAYAKRRNKKPILEGTMRFLIKWDIALITIHNVCISAVAIWHQVLYETYESKCDILVTTWHCSILKVPCLLTVVALSVTQILMTLEMTLATFAPFLVDDPDEVIRLRKIFTAVLCVLPLLPVIYVNLAEDFMAPKIYCSNSSSRTENRNKAIYGLMVVVDTMGMLASFTLLRWNSVGLKTNRHAFNVNGKYRLRKNTASLRLLTAVLCARAVTIGFYLVSSFVVREILDYSDQTTWRATVESLYLVEWYAGALALVLLFQDAFTVGHRKVLPSSAAANTYFSELSRQWDAGAPPIQAAQTPIFTPRKDKRKA